ncbi:hypothetical protein GCM10007147_44910 [Nocardiopsis kunsanensis]|uniref:Uncharacterized protein n=1 Tax=Nocardiopsis kunsanensis TaxID=141693 RepID=A0A919CLK0_9ACTN|nr:hypothetical protein [Nocardiopsis kunsanensis]GHD37115.1 hypothetical protein GCM10007147_44910 [Nocardiopsis kunsanensis]
MNPKKYEVSLGSKVSRKKAEKESASTPAPPPADGIPEAMSLDQIAAVSPGERRQLNVGVPEQLLLHRRTALYREDHGLHATRQNIVAAAVDEWLRARGY